MAPEFLPKSLRNLLVMVGARKALRFFREILFYPRLLYSRHVKKRLNCRQDKGLEKRCLEIGPGNKRLPDFETLNITPGPNVDHISDASKPLPFDDNTFEIIYASHVLEHIPWYKVEDTLREWIRILKSGGQIEIWVPDGLKICKALVDYELYGKNYIGKDGWYKYNPEKEPCKWAAGRLFTYGDGTGNPNSTNWHRSLFTPRYLKNLLKKVGLTDVRCLSHKEVRGYDHGWINLGMTGIKP